MPGRQAKILSDQQIEALLWYAASTRNSDRNRVIVLLSTKAGLRAGEIANLTWDMVVGPAGDIGTVLELHDRAAKKKSGRLIPIHPDLQAALIVWGARTPRADGPVITSERGSRMTAVSIVNWFAEAFRSRQSKSASTRSAVLNVRRFKNLVCSPSLRWHFGPNTTADLNEGSQSGAFLIQGG
jgi:integrase